MQIVVIVANSIEYMRIYRIILASDIPSWESSAMVTVEFDSPEMSTDLIETLKAI